MRINFDFADLEAFISVSEIGSFQGAAENLGISQSAVTRRIQKLEAALRVRLFERTTRSLKQTLAAKEFKTRAEQLLSGANEAQRAMADGTVLFQFQKHDLVSVAVTPTLTHALLGKALADLKHQVPGARVSVLDLFANEVIEAVKQGDADFGVGFIGIQEPGMEFRHLLDDRFVAALPPTHELAVKTGISWRELADFDLIVPAKGGGNRLLIDNTLARKNLMLKWSYQVRHSATMLDLVKLGTGIAVLPASAASGHSPQVTLRPLKGPVVSRPIGAIYRAGRQLSETARQLDQNIIQACRRMLVLQGES